MNIFGRSVLRNEDPRFVTGAGTFLDDVPLDDAAHVVFVRATVAHARITDLDVEPARGAPGVLGAFTAGDVDWPPIAPSPQMHQSMVRPFLADETVRHVGEPLAAIVAETQALALDAADLVVVDYEDLPVVLDPLKAAGAETVLHEGASSNLASTFAGGNLGEASRMGDCAPDDPFADCEVVVELSILNQRLAPCPIEARNGAAVWEEDRLVQHAATQEPHEMRDRLAAVHGLDPERVRVVVRDVGGGFGVKTGLAPEEALLGLFAALLGRPVRWSESRSESMVTLPHGRAQRQRVVIGGDRDGRIKAYTLHVVQDAGAYPGIGAILPFLTMRMAPGVYDIPFVGFTGESVVTCTTPTTSYRGAGRPEATAAIERALDRYAAEIGIDPAEVRRRNLVPADAFPWKTAVGTTYDCGDYEAALDLALETVGYTGLRREQASRRKSGSASTRPGGSPGPERQLGIGLSLYVEITNPVRRNGEFGAVEVHEDGSATVWSGTGPTGQGHETAWAMLAADETGIPIERIRVVFGDTDAIPWGHGTGGSRSLQVGGVAVHRATATLVESAGRRAAALLEAAEDDVVLDRADGRFHVRGTPAKSLSWADLAAATQADGERLTAADEYTGPSTFPFGAHVAVVEVDAETGSVDLVRMVTVDDAGRILNPMLAEGQVQGGVAQGASQALYEEMCFDDVGTPVTANFADYGIPAATELPAWQSVAMETPTPLNDLGAKGIGESGTIGATPAVQNAVVDALSHLGVRHVDMPCTPARVWDAIRTARAGGPRGAGGPGHPPGHGPGDGPEGRKGQASSNQASSNHASSNHASSNQEEG